MEQSQRDDEWETDSVDSQPDRAMQDPVLQEKRKHGKLRKDSTSSKRRARSRGVGGDAGPSSQGVEAEREEEAMPELEDDPYRFPASAEDEMPAIESDSDSTSSPEDDWQNEDDMDTDETNEENEEDGEDEEMDAVMQKAGTSASLLVAPLPPLPFHLSIPALLLAREFSGLTSYVSPALIRQKLTGQREIIQRFALWAKLEQHTGCVNALNFNPSGTILASGSDDLDVILWDWSKKKVKYSFASGHYSNVFQTKFMPLSNDSLMVTASRDGNVRLAELSTAGAPPTIKVLCRHHGSCHKIDVRADATHTILSCGEDAAVFNVDIREGKAKKALTVYEKTSKVPLYSIHSNPHNAVQFVVAGYDRFVRVYDLRFLDSQAKGAVQPVLKLCPPLIRQSESVYSVSSAVFNHNGSEILASYNDYNVFLFKNGTDEEACTIPLQEYEGHRNNQTVKSVNFYGARSEFVVSGSDCGKVFFWDKSTARIVHFLEADGIGAVNVLEPHPTDPIFATSGLEHSVKVWAPTAESRVDLDQLIPVIEKNVHDRKKEYRQHRRNHVDEGQFFMMLMNSLARRARNAAPRDAPPPNPDEMPPLEENSDASGDDDGPVPGMPNCGTS